MATTWGGALSPGLKRSKSNRKGFPEIDEIVEMCYICNSSNSIKIVWSDSHFSLGALYSVFAVIFVICEINCVCINVDIYEPRYEKTGLRGFRPGPTQTGLYSHRRWLEA